MPRGEKVCAFIEAYCNNNWQGAENAPRNRCRRIDICACELVPARRNSGVLGPLLDTLGHLLFCRFSIDRCSNLPSRKHHLINTVCENHQMKSGEKVCALIEAYCKIPDATKIDQPIKPMKFQKQFILDVYDNSHGTSRAYLSVARKNGKSVLIAAGVLALVY